MKRASVLLATTGLVFIAAVMALSSTGGFDDVDDSSIFASDIAWLAETGVTRGCNPPENNRFCPDDPVTREQMAAFFHRFARSLPAASSPGEPPSPSEPGPNGAVNAVNRASQFGASSTTVAGGESVTLAAITLDPTDGEFVALSASAWNLVEESDLTPESGEPLALSIGWLQVGDDCPAVPLGEEGPLPPPGFIPGSEFPLLQGFIGPASGSISVGFMLDAEPVQVLLCSAVLPLFGGEVVEYGSAGLTAVQSSVGSVTEYTP